MLTLFPAQASKEERGHRRYLVELLWQQHTNYFPAPALSEASKQNYSGSRLHHVLVQSIGTTVHSFILEEKHGHRVAGFALHWLRHSSAGQAPRNSNSSFSLLAGAWYVILLA